MLEKKVTNDPDTASKYGNFPSYGGCNKPKTRGVWIWPEIYTREYDLIATTEKRRIAIILLDIQGFGSYETSEKESKMTFALSTLFSLMQFYNLDIKDFNSNDLYNLELFMDYSDKIMKKSSVPKRIPSYLHFVFRNLDPFFTNTGFKENNQPIKREVNHLTFDYDLLRETLKNASKKFKNRIEKTFKRVHAHALPFPFVKRRSYYSFHDDVEYNITTKFGMAVATLTTDTFDPINVHIQIEQLELLRPNQLVELWKNYVRSFNLPEANTEVGTYL